MLSKIKNGYKGYVEAWPTRCPDNVFQVVGLVGHSPGMQQMAFDYLSVSTISTESERGFFEHANSSLMVTRYTLVTNISVHTIG